MPYEATVPVHRRLLWPAVTDPERLLSALPNVSIDASGAQGVAGRLRVRTRDQTVTFRGVARIVEVVPTALRVSLEVEAVFGRGGGSVEGVVEIALRQAGSGTRVIVGGQVDVAPGAVALSAEALSSAFQRVVQRWFGALAEASPAGMRERSEDAAGQDAPGPSERAPLAVVRDVPAEPGPSSNGSTPVPRPQPPVSAAAAKSEQADDDASGEADQPVEPDVPVEPEPPAPTPLRLVAPSESAAVYGRDDDEREDQAGEQEHGDDADKAVEARVAPVADPGPAAVSDTSALPALTGGAAGDLFGAGAAEAAQQEADDIWSRLRDRSLPPWIPFLVGAATATLAAVVLLIAALRRAAHRR